MRFLRRISKAWKLATRDAESVDRLSHAQIDALLPEAKPGNGAALGEGTHEEFLAQEKEDRGLKGIFGTK